MSLRFKHIDGHTDTAMPMFSSKWLLSVCRSRRLGDRWTVSSSPVSLSPSHARLSLVSVASSSPLIGWQVIRCLVSLWINIYVPSRVRGHGTPLIGTSHISPGHTLSNTNNPQSLPHSEHNSHSLLLRLCPFWSRLLLSRCKHSWEQNSNCHKK